MYPKTFFAEESDQPELGRCFVLMPFAAKFDQVQEALASVISGDRVNFSSKRADEIFGAGHIIGDILSEIARAEVVVADVTDRNPNVFYELGIVHTVKDAPKVIIITQTLDDVPFDIQQYRCLQYEPTDDGLRELQEDLVRAFAEVAEDSFRLVGEDEVGVECDRKFLGPDRWLYRLSIPELYVEPDFAKFRLKVVRRAIGKAEEVVSDGGQALHLGESMEIPQLGWTLRLEEVDDRRASFRVAKI